jgi:hypothetical protein
MDDHTPDQPEGRLPPAAPPPPPPPPSGLAPPPGYVAYGPGSYGAFSPFARVKGVGKALWILVIVVAAGQLAALVANLTARSEAADFLAGRIDEDEFLSGYGPSLAASALTGVANLAVVILTMIWMYRLAANLERLGRTGRTWSPGWAIGGWFLPPVLFVIPWLMFRELWRGSDPSAPPGAPDWRQRRVSPVVDLWWVLYGLAPALMLPFGVGLAVSGGFASDAEDIAERIEDQWVLNTVSGLLTLAAAVTYLVLVRQLTERHAQLTHET